MNFAWFMGTSAGPSLRSVLHLSRTVVSLIPSSLATLRTATLYIALQCTSSFGTSPFSYTWAQTMSTCFSVSGAEASVALIPGGADSVTSEGLGRGGADGGAENPVERCSTTSVEM